MALGRDSMHCVLLIAPGFEGRAHVWHEPWVLHLVRSLVRAGSRETRIYCSLSTRDETVLRGQFIHKSLLFPCQFPVTQNGYVFGHNQKNLNEINRVTPMSKMLQQTNPRIALFPVKYHDKQ